jgi:2,3-bisphosphoglycerate-dependent phosphoglycerate mutase
MLKASGIVPDVAFTSVLRRAQRTLQLCCREASLPDLPTAVSWRLNERHYGGLTGLNKAETEAQHGAAQLHAWRRSYATPPPPVEKGSAHDPRSDPKYDHLPDDLIPAGESLALTRARVSPYWHQVGGWVGRSISFCCHERKKKKEHGIILVSKLPQSFFFFSRP